MRFLVDENLSFRLTAHLHEGGHDALHVDDVGLGSAADLEILEFAAHEDRIVLSSDTDFGALLAVHRLRKPSVILTREVSTYPAADLAALLLVNLDDLAEALGAGAVVAIGPEVMRVRALPVR